MQERKGCGPESGVPEEVSGELQSQVLGPREGKREDVQMRKSLQLGQKATAVPACGILYPRGGKYGNLLVGWAAEGREESHEGEWDGDPAQAPARARGGRRASAGVCVAVSTIRGSLPSEPKSNSRCGGTVFWVRLPENKDYREQQQ